MNIPLVSIIIPVFNAEKYIGETIRSAMDQTWGNKEIIIVDDGSTDNSFAIASKFQNEQVKLLRQENSGASAARNHGLKKSKGQYIQFLDADDLLSFNKIQAQMEQLTPGDGNIALCGTIHFQDGEDPFGNALTHEWFETGSDDPADLLIKLYGGAMIGPQYGGMIQPNAWLTPRSVIDKAGFWNENLTLDDDGEFFCRVVLESSGIRYAHGAVNYYRKFNNKASLSARTSVTAGKSIVLSNQLKAAHLLAKNNGPSAKLALSRLFWETAFNLFPGHLKLSKASEQMARSLAPDLEYKPYHNGAAAKYAGLVGWKIVKCLQYLKSSLVSKNYSYNGAN